MSPFSPPPPIRVQVNDVDVDLISIDVNDISELVHSRGARPDPHWEMVDSKGHYHAHSTALELNRMLTRYPTLTSRSEKVPCDGTCGGTCGGEGSTVTKFSCRICNEDIKPGLIPGPHTSVIYVGTDWTLDVTYCPGTVGEQVTVRLSDGRFGVAAITRVSNSSIPFEPSIYELVGVSPLGMRVPDSTPARD